MRAHVPAYNLVVPGSLTDCLARLKDEPGRWRPFAGGTDLMVLFEAGKLQHREFLSLTALKELQGIAWSDTHLTLGALTTYSDLRADARVTKEFALLTEAASQTGALAIQNRGTVGGNIANASPAADTPPALLVYDAELELMSSGGSRWVPYAGFHTDYKKTLLRPDEIIARVRLPRLPSGEWKTFYRKVGTRKAQAISKVALAGLARMSGGRIEEARFALASVAPVPLRAASAAEATLKGQAPSKELSAACQKEFAAQLKPITDIRSTDRYRRQVALNVLEEFIDFLGSVRA